MLTKVFGLTGPTGAGKTTAAEMFRQLGAAVIDCDVVAGQVLRMPECMQKLQEAFGEDVVNEKGVDRALLASRAFSSPENTLKLNGVTHPFILKEIERRIDAYKEEGAPSVLVDGAVIFESGIDRIFDTTVVILAEHDIRLQRILNRDGITEEQARQRISAQKPDDFYKERAGYLLDGGLKLSELQHQVKMVYDSILEAE